MNRTVLIKYKIPKKKKKVKNTNEFKMAIVNRKSLRFIMYGRKAPSVLLTVVF